MRRIILTMATSAAMAVFTHPAGAFATDSETNDPSAGPSTAVVLSDIADALAERPDAPAPEALAPADVSGQTSTADLPEAGADAAEVTTGTGTLTMDVPATGADRAPASDATALFDGTAADTTVAVQGTTQGLRALVHIDSPDAPERFDFPIGGDVTSLQPTASGGIDALNDAGEIIATAPAPWATDANGVAVPTHYEINGTNLTQVVEHHASSYAYGIVADPSWHWWGVSWKLSHSKTQQLVYLIDGGVGVAGITALLCGGTIAGAIPCGIGYGAVAVLGGFAVATLNYCDRRSTGIELKYHWFGGWWSCEAR